MEMVKNTYKNFHFLSIFTLLHVFIPTGIWGTGEYFKCLSGKNKLCVVGLTNFALAIPHIIMHSKAIYKEEKKLNKNEKQKKEMIKSTENHKTEECASASGTQHNSLYRNTIFSHHVGMI